MNSVNFYHLNKTDTYFALCKLVNQAFAQERKVLVRTSSQEVTEEINEILWSYDLTSFLPHSKAGDQNNEASPIHISNESDNPNNASYLFVVNNSNFSIPEICQFQRTFIIFNNQDKEFMDIARKLWVDTAGSNLGRRYWVEEDTGWILKKDA